MLNAVLLKPLPYEDSEQLVTMWQRFTGIGVPKDQNWTSAPEFSDVRRMQSSFSDIAAMQGTSFTILVGDTPERILGQFVSPSFFKLLGVEAFLGRTFSPDEEQQGKEAVVVMSHGLWQRRFASDRALIERTLNMNGRPYQVIGIAPPGFRDPLQPEAEMWAALSFTNQQLTQQRGSHGLLVIARIKPELTLEQARSDMARVSERIIEGAPEYPYAKFGYRVLINPLLEEAVGDIRPALLMLMGSVGLVLLIACTNVANLLLVRASAREREIGIRTALGAGRGRLIRQMLTESVVLSLVGAVVGVALARVGVSVLATMAAQSFPRLADTRIDLIGADVHGCRRPRDRHPLRPLPGIPECAWRDAGGVEGRQPGVDHRAAADSVFAGCWWRRRSPFHCCCWSARVCSSRASCGFRRSTPGSIRPAFSPCESSFRRCGIRSPIKCGISTKRC